MLSAAVCLVQCVCAHCRHSPPYFFEELHGLADATGVDYDLLLRVHMLPELVKVPTPPPLLSLSVVTIKMSISHVFFPQAGCSMLGAWGKATANPSATIQVRPANYPSCSIL